MNNNFGNKLDDIRKERGLSMKQLAKLAGISRPLVSNLINNRRVIGEYTARKLGVALQLEGDELQAFIFSAINNSTEKVLNSCKAFPSEVLNLVAGELSVLGIVPETIEKCERHPGAHAALHLTDGRKATIKLEIACC